MLLLYHQHLLQCSVHKSCTIVYLTVKRNGEVYREATLKWIWNWFIRINRCSLTYLHSCFINNYVSLKIRRRSRHQSKISSYFIQHLPHPFPTGQTYDPQCHLYHSESGGSRRDQPLFALRWTCSDQKPSAEGHRCKTSCRSKTMWY